jgi:hypothetical protein
MSWLFSQALAAAYWPVTCSDGAPSAPLSRTDSAHPFLRNGKTMDFCRLSPSGVMCAVLTADHGEALLMSYRAAFPARTSVWRAPARGLTGSAPGYGATCGVSFATFSPDMRSWRTAQHSLLEGWDMFLQTWPRQGLLWHGKCYPLPIAARGTSAPESGLLPTLVKRGLDGGAHARQKMARFPTLTKNDSKNTGSPSRMRRNTLPLDAVAGGPLNLEWCEWFMGWPIGWTALEPLEMVRFQLWQRGLLPSSQQPCTPQDVDRSNDGAICDDG